MIIKLTWHEMRQASTVGMMRQIAALYDKRVERHGASANNVDPWEKHIMGAQAEMAVAKMLNLYWNGTIGETDKPDLIDWDGQRLQVRSRKRSDGDLILHHSDADDDKFYCVRVLPPQSFDVPGWLYARDGKQEKYWRTERGNPAFFVPAEDLNKIELTDSDIRRIEQA